MKLFSERHRQNSKKKNFSTFAHNEVSNRCNQIYLVITSVFPSSSCFGKEIGNINVILGRISFDISSIMKFQHRFGLQLCLLPVGGGPRKRTYEGDGGKNSKYNI